MQLQGTVLFSALRRELDAIARELEAMPLDDEAVSDEDLEEMLDNLACRQARVRSAMREIGIDA